MLCVYPSESVNIPKLSEETKKEQQQQQSTKYVGKRIGNCEHKEKLN